MMLIKREQQNFTAQNPDNTIPVWLYQDFHNPGTVGPTHQEGPSPHLSATALLQKASLMGHHVHADPCNQTAGFGLNFSSREGRAAGFVHSPFGGGNSNNAAVSSGVTGHESPAMAGGGGTGAPSSLIQDMVEYSLSSGNGFEGMTRDFLGLRPLSHSEILNMAGFSSDHIDGLNENHNQTQKSWQGN